MPIDEFWNNKVSLVAVAVDQQVTCVSFSSLIIQYQEDYRVNKWSNSKLCLYDQYVAKTVPKKIGVPIIFFIEYHAF